MYPTLIVLLANSKYSVLRSQETASTSVGSVNFVKNSYGSTQRTYLNTTASGASSNLKARPPPATPVNLYEMSHIPRSGESDEMLDYKEEGLAIGVRHSIEVSQDP